MQKIAFFLLMFVFLTSPILAKKEEEKKAPKKFTNQKKPKNPFKNIQKLMEAVEKKLVRYQVGEKTQKVQNMVVREIQKLIDKIKDQQSQSNSSSNSDSKKKKKDQKNNKNNKDNKNNKNNQNNKNKKNQQKKKEQQKKSQGQKQKKRPKPLNPHKNQKSKKQDNQKRLGSRQKRQLLPRGLSKKQRDFLKKKGLLKLIQKWGSLPPTVKKDVFDAIGKEFPRKFSKELRQYFKALSDLFKYRDR